MKENVLEKIYLSKDSIGSIPNDDPLLQILSIKEDGDIEYIRKDVFMKKAKKWFEKQNEWFDPNCNRHCDLNDFEDFRNYMKG